MKNSSCASRSCARIEEMNTVGISALRFGLGIQTIFDGDLRHGLGDGLRDHFPVESAKPS